MEKDTLENCFDANSDGAGFAYIDDGTLMWMKGFFTFDEFYKAYAPHAERELIAHFRIATAGVIDTFNCHPWIIENCQGYAFAVMHNGVLAYPSSKDKSDTGHFVDELLTPLLQHDPHFFDSQANRWMVEKAIGGFNKLIILRSDGKSYIINRDAGEEHDTGTWFSNTTFKYGSGFGRYGGRAYAPNGRGGWGMYGDEDWPMHRPSSSTTVTNALPGPTGEVAVVAPLAHLSKRNRKRLIALSGDQFKGSGMTEMQQVDCLREMFIDEHPMYASLTDRGIDEQILKMNYNGWSLA